MISIIDFSSTKRQAFIHGFWKGLAAPLVLFSACDLPPQAAPVTFRPLERRPSSGIAGDWVRVGQGLRTAAERARTAANGE